MNKLTLIVTFLNEGIEVRNTIESFRNSTKEPFDIILINDGSTDIGIDYEKIAKEFGARYIKHIERQGTANSRNEGVSLCTTKYFIHIDAHMRVYQDNWVSNIVNELEKEENTLLCCSTLSLNKDASIDKSCQVGYGAFINLLDLIVCWINKPDITNENSFEIPCVLGASYACSCEYWSYLRGLKGLRSYGYEEQLISMKVWLSGGKCKVLKKVQQGHIFREKDKVPYKISMPAYHANQFMIVEMFYNEEYKRKFMQDIRKRIEVETVNSGVEDLKQYRQDIIEEKEYYKKIFCRDFDFILKLNNSANFL